MTKIFIKPYIPTVSTISPGQFKGVLVDGEIRFPKPIAQAFMGRGLTEVDELIPYLYERESDIAMDLKWHRAEVALAARELRESLIGKVSPELLAYRQPSTDGHLSSAINSPKRSRIGQWLWRWSLNRQMKKHQKTRYPITSKTSASKSSLSVETTVHDL